MIRSNYQQIWTLKQRILGSAMILFIHEAIKLNINILIYYTSLQNNECFNFSIKNAVEQTLNYILNDFIM